MKRKLYDLLVKWKRDSLPAFVYDPITVSKAKIRDYFAPCSSPGFSCF